MTREDALNKTIGILTYHQVNFCKSKEAVANMNDIIEALEKIDQEQCEDCIRRSDIGLTDFEIVMCNGDYKEGLKMLLDKIEKAPSVTPMPCGDCISRKSVSGCVSAMYYKGLGKQKSLEYILKYVERLPSVSPQPCEDCISRQQAIDKMQELEEEDIEAYGCSIPEGFDGKRAIEAIKALSSVHPKPKMGHWVKVIEENGHAFYLCSVCKEGTDENYDWCPNCGSKNGGGDNGNE